MHEEGKKQVEEMGEKYRALDRDVEDSYRILRAKNPNMHILVVPAEQIIKAFYSEHEELSKKQEPAKGDTEKTKTLAERI